MSIESAATALHQSNQRKNFIPINQGFTCKNCGKVNPKAQKSYRNHCRKCLYCLHVDLEVPGDRKNECRALMKPIEITLNRKKEYSIVHRCLACGKKKRNKTADDDDFHTMIEIASSRFT